MASEPAVGLVAAAESEAAESLEPAVMAAAVLADSWWADQEAEARVQQVAPRAEWQGLAVVVVRLAPRAQPAERRVRAVLAVRLVPREQADAEARLALRERADAEASEAQRVPEAPRAWAPAARWPVRRRRPVRRRPPTVRPCVRAAHAPSPATPDITGAETIVC